MWALFLALSAFAADPTRVRFTTTEGEFVVAVHPEWAPNGAARFLEAVQAGVYDGAPVFRVVKGFVAQFGIAADPATAALWKARRMPDDPPTVPNKQWTMSFASSGPGSRTVQVFVNLKDNTALDSHGFAPFAEIVEGQDVVKSLYSGYGEGAPMGRGPSQDQLMTEGAAKVLERFPKLDVIQTAKIE